MPCAPLSVKAARRDDQDQNQRIAKLPQQDRRRLFSPMIGERVWPVARKPVARLGRSQPGRPRAAFLQHLDSRSRPVGLANAAPRWGCWVLDHHGLIAKKAASPLIDIKAGGIYDPR